MTEIITGGPEAEQQVIDTMNEMAAKLQNANPEILAATVGVMVVLALIALAAFIFIWFKFSKNMANIAADKGYTERRWFHYCFWLGLPGILMVCAMPDKKRR